MSIEEAQQIIANLCLSHDKFRPLGEPTLTPGGARIEFMKPDVDPKTIAVWFGNAGVTMTMCGVENCYATVPIWIAEFRR
jgi:hypothetical protein